MKNTGNWLQISEVQIKGMLSVTTDSYFFLYKERASQVVLVVKNLPANVGGIRDAGSIPGWEDPLEKSMTTHSSILALKIPRTEEAGETMRLQRVGHVSSD